MRKIGISFARIALTLVVGISLSDHKNYAYAQSAPNPEFVEKCTLKNKEQVEGGQFSQDGSVIVAGSSEGKIRAWKTDTCELVWTGSYHDQCSGKKCSEVEMTVCSSDGKYVAATGNASMVKLFQANGCIPTQTTAFHTIPGKGEIDSIAFTPDATLLLVPFSGKIRFYDVSTLTGGNANEVETVNYEGNVINSIKFTSDGKYMAAGGYGKLGIVYDMQAKKVVSMLDIKKPGGGGGSIKSIAITNDGKYAATSGGRGEHAAYVFDAQSGNLLQTFPHNKTNDKYSESVTFSPDGSLLSVEGPEDRKTVTLYRMPTFEAAGKASLGAQIEYATYSPDGQYFALMGSSGIKIFSTGMKTSLPVAAPTAPVTPAVGTP
jgi:WD40 repeat protein